MIILFGLYNISVVFQTIINTINQELLDKEVVVFIDNILKFSYKLKENI